MIIKVKKFLFVGAKQDLDAFYSTAQEAGLIEFISPEGRRRIEYPEKIHEMIKAIKILKKQPEHLPQEEGDDAQKTAKQVVDCKAVIDEGYERARQLRSEIMRIAPFGEFSLNEVAGLELMSLRKMRFYCMKSSKAASADLPEILIPIATEYDMDYFISLEGEGVALPHLIEMPIEHSLSELRGALAATEKEITQAEQTIKELTAALSSLQKNLGHTLDHYHLKEAKDEASKHLEGELFSSEAYIPKNRVAEVEQKVENLALHMEEINMEKEERVPTYMENSGVGRIGEDLVHVYDTPSTADRDPSSWVYWAFILFFAMIVSDGGYGSLYLSLGLFLKWKFSKIKGSGRRFINLIVALGTGCVIWGFLTASFFGIDLAPDNPLRKHALTEFLAAKKADYHMAQKDDVWQQWTTSVPKTAQATSGKEFLLFGTTIKDGKQTNTLAETFNLNLMMEFSLLVGVIHIILSLARTTRQNIANFGWIILMVGGYLFLPSMLKATTMINFLSVLSKESATAIGLYMCYGGLGFAIFAAILQKGFVGIAEPLNLIQFFSDVLSYLRLYALGLAGMLMASTFNDLGSSTGPIFGPFIIIAGHSVNIVLGIMGGVIHGLRLNFLEWYHWSFEGGGKLFKPLSRGMK